ncbi:cytochrome P460 family protein [Roseivirga sp. E12]|uniref:cytochrome P460 family protein n=1 Tax=Roseivirga sp. E12 TaxID=2819237 RepID=UPI001ABC1534|nr:cytochrome P460 family protein [Roseivirga sp. E12]MBO3698254.1 cytochrome P460 family protein [Roseivirga sp. E12]
MKKILLAIFAFIIFGFTFVNNVPEPFSAHVDEDGNISVPKDYRDWTFIGAWSIKGDNGAAGLHLVYTQAETAAHYKEKGEFPDGAVLVKELQNTESQTLTTGRASRASGVAGWFVMIKDTEGRYPENKLWGNGWGWAYFDADDPIKTTSTDFKLDCLGCHVPAASTDWVYMDGYPVLTK